jgi:hypothetical protein
MKTATSAQRVEIAGTAGADGPCAADAWDSASVKHLKQLISALDMLAKSTNDPAHESKGRP